MIFFYYFNFRNFSEHFSKIMKFEFKKIKKKNFNILIFFSKLWLKRSKKL